TTGASISYSLWRSSPSAARGDSESRIFHARARSRPPRRVSHETGNRSVHHCRRPPTFRRSDAAGWNRMLPRIRAPLLVATRTDPTCAVRRLTGRRDRLAGLDIRHWRGPRRSGDRRSLARRAHREPSGAVDQRARLARPAWTGVAAAARSSDIDRYI